MSGHWTWFLLNVIINNFLTHIFTTSCRQIGSNYNSDYSSNKKRKANKRFRPGSSRNDIKNEGRFLIIFIPKNFLYLINLILTFLWALISAANKYDEFFESNCKIRSYLLKKKDKKFFIKKNKVECLKIKNLLINV